MSIILGLFTAVAVLVSTNEATVVEFAVWWWLSAILWECLQCKAKR